MWELLRRDAVVYVCENPSTVAPGVRGALLAICRDQTDADAAGAEAWLAALRADGRYLEDMWGETSAV